MLSFIIFQITKMACENAFGKCFFACQNQQVICVLERLGWQFEQLAMFESSDFSIKSLDIIING